MKKLTRAAYLRMAAVLVAVGIAAIMGNWLSELVTWPSDSEVQENLMAIQDREAADLSRQWAAELWYDREKQKEHRLPIQSFEALYKPACLFAKSYDRSPGSDYITWRRWGYAHIPRSTSKTTPVAGSTIVILISADVLGLDRVGFHFFSSPNYREELVARRIISFDDLKIVDDCQ